MGNFFDQAKKFQAELKDVQVSGESGAGMVKVSMDGRYYILDIEVDDEIYKEGKTIAIDLIKGAAVDAAAKVKQAVEDKMSDFASSFGLLKDKKVKGES